MTRLAAVRRLRRVPARLRRAPGELVTRARTARWEPWSHVFVLGDELGWALDDEATYVAGVAQRAGHAVGPSGWARHTRRQAVFHTSHFAGLDPLWLDSTHRLGLAYFHGRPGTPGYDEFDWAFHTLRSHHDRIARVQVTHTEMEELVLTAGVAHDRVHRIPIGIELDAFPLGTPERRHAARASLGLPQDAFVVGSFQKDGLGWGHGLEPKWIKGPDILVEALVELDRRVDDLVVLLTGPSRGFVRTGLDAAGVRHFHRLLPDRSGLLDAYHSLDAYAVASRQEGGPKSILESMATGTAIVSTRAGQANDLVTDGVNGLLVDIEDAAALAAALERIHDDPGRVSRFRAAGRVTAAANAHAALAPRWEALFEGFVA
jgi:glycosyltransferase involved in cell wall biosynthesis